MAGAAVGGLMNQSTPQTQSTTQQGQSQTASQFNPNPAAMPMYGMVGGIGQNMGQTPTPYFPGQTYVGPSGMTMQGVEGLNNLSPWYQGGAQLSGAGGMMMGAGAGQMGQAGGAYNQAAGGMQPTLNTSQSNYNYLSGAADVANNPYVQGQLQANADQVNRNLNEQMLPQLQTGAQSVNAMGNDRLGLAQGQAIEGASRQLADVNASTMLSAYGQGLGAQQTALGQTGNMLNNQLMPANAMAMSGQAYGQGGQMLSQGGQMYGQAGNMMGQDAQAKLQGGQIVEGYQGAALQDQMNRFNHMYTEPWQRSQNMQGAINTLQPLGTQYGSGASSSMGTAPNPNYLSTPQAMLGGAFAGHGLYSAFNPTPQVSGAGGWGSSAPMGYGPSGSLIGGGFY
jgi:hypothetical protein